MLGYGLAVVLGITLGLAMGYYRPLYNLFEPLVEVLRPIPGPAYLPVLVLFVGHRPRDEGGVDPGGVAVPDPAQHL